MTKVTILTIRYFLAIVFSITVVIVGFIINAKITGVTLVILWVLFGVALISRSAAGEKLK